MTTLMMMAMLIVMVMIVVYVVSCIDMLSPSMVMLMAVIIVE
jgi:hypothetical protein